MSNLLNPGQKIVDFGPLQLTFTSHFEPVWNDRNSDADKDLAIWKPIAPDGFHICGHIAIDNYDPASDQYAVLCVKALPGQEDVLKAPTKYEKIWSDDGSAAHEDGACWRPVAPEGYVALGDVFGRYNKFLGKFLPPSLDEVVCVRKDFAIRANVAEEPIWTDKGSGSDRDFSAWQIVATSNYRPGGKGTIMVNSFVGNSGIDGKGYDRPLDAPEVNGLYLPIPAQAYEEPPVPVLTSLGNPPDNTNPCVDHGVVVPFTAITDKAVSLKWQVENSPFYLVERLAFYSLVLFDRNDTSAPEKNTITVVAGMEKSEGESFWESTGVKISQSTGISLGAISKKVSIEIAQQMGFEKSSSWTIFGSQEVSNEFMTPPHGATAIWNNSYNMRVRRTDGDYLENLATIKGKGLYPTEFKDPMIVNS